jgi:hypothetical protein
MPRLPPIDSAYKKGGSVEGAALLCIGIGLIVVCVLVAIFRPDAWSEVEGFEHEYTYDNDDLLIEKYILRTSDSYMRFGDNTKHWDELKNAILGMLPPSAGVDLN